MYSRILGRDSWDQENMDRQTVFRINDNGLGPELLTQVLLERGWIEYEEEHHGEHGWHIWWRTTRFRTSEYSGLLPWQKINHFPNCGAITRKDALCRNLRKMRIVHGPNVYSFSPQAYNLPNDYTKFVSEYAKLRNQAPSKAVAAEKDTGTPGRANENKQSHLSTQDQSSESTQQNQRHQQQQQQQPLPTLWICKPAESSRGRGIFIFQHLSELRYDCNAVVQQYIPDPLLIGGYKFDIRVYVAVPSFNPFQVYIHEEGLVRFSTEKYDLDRPDNVFAHLTNTSINKFSPGYTTDKEEVGHGCKWTISQLRRYFLQNNINDTALWQRITNIIILTLLIQAPSAPKITNCFELYGFDILVDSHLRPWLLEVNVGPALSSDCQADLLAKKSMLHDLFDMVFTEPSAGGDSAFFHSHNMSEVGGVNAGGGVGGLGLGRYFMDETNCHPDCVEGDESRGGSTGWSQAGLGSLEELTDRTVTSLNSPRRSSRSNMTGRTSMNTGNVTLRHGGSLHNLNTNSSSSNPTRPVHKRLSEPGAHVRSHNTRNNHDNSGNILHRKGSLRETALTRRRSFKVESDQKGPKSETDRKPSNFLLPPANPLDLSSGDSLFEEDYTPSDFHGKKSLNNIRFRSIEDNNLPELRDKALVAPSDSGALTGDSKNTESHGMEVSIQHNDTKTSNYSDSGLSSLSQSSGENSGIAASRHLNVKNTKGENLSAENTGSMDSKSSGYTDDFYKDGNSNVQNVGAELMRKLSELPQRQREEVAMLDKFGAEESEDLVDTRPMLIHGNMKRQGVRRLLLPSPDRGFPPTASTTNDNNYKNDSNTSHKVSNCNSPVSAPLLHRKALSGSNSSLHTSVSVGKNNNKNSNDISPRSLNNNNNGTSRRQYPRQQLQQRQTASCYSHPADEKQARLYAIPRNFSRTEAARFPHSYQHGRHRHENIKNIPGTPQMPSKKIGRFFLVFPFSETTHRLSQGKLDAKAIIKEVQKYLRENLKRNSRSNNRNDGKDLEKEGFEQDGGVQHIWAPLKSGDVFD